MLPVNGKDFQQQRTSTPYQATQLPKPKQEKRQSFVYDYDKIIANLSLDKENLLLYEKKEKKPQKKKSRPRKVALNRTLTALMQEAAADAEKAEQNVSLFKKD